MPLTKVKGSVLELPTPAKRWPKWNEVSDKPSSFPVELTDIDTVGTIIGYASETPPKGWLVCDGSYFDKNKAPELYKLLNSPFLPFIPPENGKYSIIRHDAKNDPSTILDIRNWVAISNSLNSGGRGGPIDISASGATVIAVFSSGYASISNDSGKTWTSLPRGFNTGAISDIYSIGSSGPVFIVGFRDGKAFRTGDYGRTWTSLPQNLNALESSYSQEIRAIAGSGNTFIAGLKAGYASISKDAGNTWKMLDFQSQFYLGRIDTISACKNVFLVGTQGSCIRSDDYGETWKQIPYQFGISAAGNIKAIASAHNTFVVGLARGNAVISDDSGETWRALPPSLGNGPKNYDICSMAVSGSTFIAGFKGGFASISTDLGKTWRALPRGLNTYNPTDSTVTCLAATGSTFIAGFNTAVSSRGTPGPEVYYNPNYASEALMAENRIAKKDREVVSLYRSDPQAAFEKLLYENIRGYEPIETIDEKLNTEDEKEDELK